MAEHDTDPLTDEERAELEQLRAEKARRAAEEKARLEREELQALRAEKDKARLAEVKRSKKTVQPKREATPAREDMSFAQRMVTSTEPKDADDIPGMAPAQKLIIVLALIAFVIFIGYSVLTSTGMIG